MADWVAEIESGQSGCILETLIKTLMTHDISRLLIFVASCLVLPRPMLSKSRIAGAVALAHWRSAQQKVKSRMA